MQTQQLLTPSELADRLKVSRVTVTKWRKAGIIPGIQINPAVTRYDIDDVITALKRRNAKPEAAQ